MPQVSANIEIDVDLANFSTEDLRAELACRDEVIDHDLKIVGLVNKIYELRRNNYCYQQSLDDLIYEALGKII